MLQPTSEGKISHIDPCHLMTKRSAGDDTEGVNAKIRAWNRRRNGYFYILLLPAIASLKRRKKKWKTDCRSTQLNTNQAIRNHLQSSKTMGGEAAFTVYSIPACLRRSLPGTRFSDTLQDFQGSWVAAPAAVMLPSCSWWKWQQEWKFALLCWNFTGLWLRLSQMQLTHKKMSEMVFTAGTVLYSGWKTKKKANKKHLSLIKA